MDHASARSCYERRTTRARTDSTSESARGPSKRVERTPHHEHAARRGASRHERASGAVRREREARATEGAAPRPSVPVHARAPRDGRALRASGVPSPWLYDARRGARPRLLLEGVPRSGRVAPRHCPVPVVLDVRDPGSRRDALRSRITVRALPRASEGLSELSGIELSYPEQPLGRHDLADERSQGGEREFLEGPRPRLLATALEARSPRRHASEPAFSASAHVAAARTHNGREPDDVRVSAEITTRL